MSGSGKVLRIADDYEVDAVEYASRANAALGIRDSGKTYTCTMIAEQMFDLGIPFFTFDPIGRWRFLRVPGKGPGGRGYPVVVAGGRAPDLPLTPEDAPKYVRAAMQAGVSVVIDLYDVGLSKAAWRSIVRNCIQVILYEGEGHGLRHVFLEEAAEFIPQQVRDGLTYAEIEKLARMGGNVGCGLTLINQRAEEVNKAVLELADNLMLHRQRGKNSLRSLAKWLEMGNVRPPREITDSLADLPTGQCWAWFKDVGVPRLIKVAAKHSFDPDRRALAASSASQINAARADVTDFIAAMRGALSGKKPESKKIAPAAPAPAPRQEDPVVKESEARALREENAAQKAQIAELRAKLDGLALERPPAPATTSGQALDMDALYADFRRRLLAEPKVIEVAAQRPEIEVRTTRRTIQMEETSLDGQVAILISKGFFDNGATGNSAFVELKRRGFSVAKPSVYRSCDKISSLGFLTKENDGYRAVPEMKINVVEA